MKKLTIALISGGTSPERMISIAGGDHVYQALDKKLYRIIRYDLKTDVGRLVADANKIDAAFVVLHGICGEDGTVQGLLDLLGLPYQCTGVLGSALAMNKLASKQIYEQKGLPVPPYKVLRCGDTINPRALVECFGLPLVVKPVIGGSSIGMEIVRSEDAVKEAVEQVFKHDKTVLVEKYINGVEITAGVLGNNTLTVLPIIQIIPGDGYDFFNYEAKYKKDAAQEICPAKINNALTQKAQKYGKIAHKALFCKGYSRTDMIVDGKDIYVLETNTIPGMTPGSLFPLAARTAGISFDKLLDKLIALGITYHQNTNVDM
jgi:D-alanine-D-alanine ligase